jgi:hypothetical protein
MDDSKFDRNESKETKLKKEKFWNDGLLANQCQIEIVLLAQNYICGNFGWEKSFSRNIQAENCILQVWPRNVERIVIKDKWNS